MAVWITEEWCIILCHVTAPSILTKNAHNFYSYIKKVPKFKSVNCRGREVGGGDVMCNYFHHGSSKTSYII